MYLQRTFLYVDPTYRYLCKLPDKELRGNGARHMADMMWSAIKEPVESPLCFDQDSLELAFKFFTSATLTMRLTGLGQITVSYLGVLIFLEMHQLFIFMV